ncbi:uncharacterized protein LOC123519916 isoform X3 [Portunus trituberculatus]|uniref:uncharacterized protein LOC123519916 isoform X3 n=1 Tax=Portunus trituberculatus TaxID=210409 RepID=UPI001E1CF60D|nr:uncharacterized protein LOC123519916 isoform X3 [Portunus trituberculatus]
MPVRDSATPLPHNKPRSGMFKWMISGHKGSKQKQEKLNNASAAATINNNNKNKNNLRQQAEAEDEEAQQLHQNNANTNGSVLHIPDAAEITYNNNNSTSNLHKSSGSSTPEHHHYNQHQHQQQHQQHQQHTQKHGDVNQNTDNLIQSANGVTSSVGNDPPPSPPASRPPPLPTHPPPPVPPHAQLLPQAPMQPLPPLPNQQQEEHRYQREEHRYQQEAIQQAPGTCILPRRSLGKDDVNVRYRSPSNPPPASRQPPPYSRHQPPDPQRRLRGPYQPPPPPKGDLRDPRERESRPREVRASVNLDELQDCRSRRDHWVEGDPRGGAETRDSQKNGNFREMRDIWEKRNSALIPQDPTKEDNLRSTSLPRPKQDPWMPANNRWSTREPDSGFDSLNLQTADDGQRCTEAGQSHSRAPMVLATDAHYSQSTEDLLNASRTSPMSLSSATASMSSTSSSPVQYPTIRPAKQPCITGASHTSPFSHTSPRSSPHPPGGSPRGVGPPHHHSTPVGPQRTASPEGALLSDSVYPQHDTQPRYAEIQEKSEPRVKEERMNHRLSRDLRDVRDVRELGSNRESRETTRTGRDMREPRDNRSSRELRQNRDIKSREFRETSLPRDFRETREERLNRDAATRGYRELPVDVDERDQVELRQDRLRGPRDGRAYGEGSKEVRFSNDTSENLRVRDGLAYDRRDRDGDGADGLQVNDERRLSGHQRATDHRGQRGDGCTSSSVSWMEWTQQLQAYVAWVNSQLRKRGRPLISDLRRDLQSGVVFADLIEIISGERVAGIQREGEREAISPQAMRENLDRILQFMAAKRIRMTHITSKEVAEGNLKSIMRVILALAAHYKPQSVKAASPHQQEVPPAALVCAPAKLPATHDVSVGPDGPPGGPENTPNLSANRRAIVTGGSGDDSGSAPGLRRHPSMTATPGAPRDSSPVYENLPRRVAPSRWAYDSLRASHKFQWTGPPSRRSGAGSGPNRPCLDESSDDPLNTSLNTSLTISLNTSIEGEVEPSSPALDSSGGRGSGRPAALNFWQEMTNRHDPGAPQPKSQPSTPVKAPPEDADNPFRYHTIHRMSGRRKLPQIPGAPGPGSRVSSAQESPESPRETTDSPNDRSEGKPGSGLGEDGSREPEGRSQNSSPATSLVRGHTLEQWSREKPQMDNWDAEDLKGVLRDLNNTRDQLLALQHLELDPASRGSHGPRSSELLEASTASVKQELLHLSLARQALEAEKVELTRLLEQREGVITELRKQMHQRDKAMHTQRAQFEDALRNVQNGKRVGVCGDSPSSRGGPREELHLVRDAIASLRSNFRETDPNQHTLDTLEQAISILIERSSTGTSGGGGGGSSSNDKNSRASDQRHQMNGVQDASTKVIYFTERTVTPFMSTINKPLGEIRLRDFKNMFDRPGLFRFHFKSYDPEYGMVKEEIVSDDDILPGVEGKIIAWVEEDVE